MSERRQTSQIQVGKVGVGSDYPVSVQSMTTTKTRDTDETLGQVYELANNGADIVRVTCNELEAAESLVKICARSPVPIVADIHFQYKLALAAVEAGVHGLRLNPGNIRNEKQIKELNCLLRPEDIDLLNQVEKLSTCESKLINEIKNLNYLENNENHRIMNKKKIVPSNRVSFNKISSFMINWSNKFVVIALLTISAIALSKQAWA